MASHPLFLVEASFSNLVASVRCQLADKRRRWSFCQTVDSGPFFTLAHCHRHPFETEHWYVIPGSHSEAFARSSWVHGNLFVWKPDGSPPPVRYPHWTPENTREEKETRSFPPRVAGITRCERDTRAKRQYVGRLTSFGAKEAAGCLLSSQSKPVTRNGTVDGDPPAPALGRRFPHDRLGARVEGRWSRSRPAARFEAAATVPGTTSVTRTRPFGGSEGRARLDPAYGNVAGTAKWRHHRRRRRHGMEFLRDVLNIPQRRGGRDRPSFLSPLLRSLLHILLFIPPRSSSYVPRIPLSPPPSHSVR